MNHLPEAGAGEEVVRFHTRGVRFPRLIGKTADGTRLPGGPYTITQVVATVTIFIGGQWTRPIWGGHGLASDYLALVAVAIVVGFLLRHASFGPRDPVTTALALITLYLTPTTGRRNGRPVAALKRPRRRQARPAAPRWLLPTGPTTRLESTDA